MRSSAIAAIVGIFLLAAGSAQAAPSITGTSDLSQTPGEIAAGPDGNIWVALTAMDPDFAKITPAGGVTEYTATDPTISNLKGITAGPDGNMWATMSGAVVKFSTADPTAAVKTPNANIVGPERITTGPGGILWTASADKVFRFSPATPATPDMTTVPGLNAHGITAGTDGNMYVADGNMPGRVIKVTTAGIATPINTPVTGMVQEVAAGPNGQIAYSNPGSNPESMGLMNAGVMLPAIPFPTPPDPFGITFGQDGAYWIAQFATENIGRLTTDGVYTTLGSFPALSGPRHITTGPDHTLWLTLETSKKVARVSGVDNPVTPTPVISGVSVTNKTFKVGSKKTALVAKKKKKKTPTGTTLKYTLSAAITVGIDVQKVVPGRTKGANCVKPTSKLKKAKKCTRYAVVGSFTRTAVVGANKFAFTGRYAKTKLKPGKYRFLVYGKDAIGKSAVPRDAKFTIVKK
jgi:streptogramin lyase